VGERGDHRLLRRSRARARRRDRHEGVLRGDVGEDGEIASAPPFALEDASLNAWISVRDGTDALYYPKGSLAGFLLDIMIRDASDNRSSLDLVMRELYRSTYDRGRGFTPEEWWGAVRRASNGKSYEEFNRRYIDGRDPYPWDEALKVIGLRMQSDSIPRMGVSLRPEQDGSTRVMEIVPGSPALEAGIKQGDVIVSVNERSAVDAFFSAASAPCTGRSRPARRFPSCSSATTRP
jgi:predicted metalloprotease with PDZ domain